MDKKLNKIIYEKLLLQAEEAKIQGMKKLGSAVMTSIGADHEKSEMTNYSSTELNNDIYNGLWKLAMNVINYHNVKSADIEKIDEVILTLADKFVENLENSINIEAGSIGAKDIVPGMK